MKRKLRIALIAVLVLAVSTAGASAATKIDVNFNKINIEVNGGLKAVTGEYFVRTTGNIPYSILYEGTTYLPIAKICELVGKDIGWNGNTRTVFIRNYDHPVADAPDSTAVPKSHEAVSLEVDKDVVFDSLNIVAYGQTFARPGTKFDRGAGQMVPYSLLLLYKGTTYLPLAAVCQLVGKDISWDGTTYTASVYNREALGTYPGTDVPDFGELCKLTKSTDSDDLMVYNYYDYTTTDRFGKEAEDLQKYVSYLFDAGFTFSLDDSRKLIGNEETTLYAYKNERTGRVVVVGLVQTNGLSQVVISYTK